MDMLNDKLLIVVGGILVALVAGFFSYLNLVVSKEQKISEYRERWISSLREEIAAFIAAISHLAACFSTFKKLHKATSAGTLPAADLLKFYADNASSYQAVRDNYSRITLRVNRNENDPALKAINDSFLTALEEVRSLYNDGKYPEARGKCEEFRNSAIPLLKTEWNRVRDGEPEYRRAKAMARNVLWLGLVTSAAALIFSVKSGAGPVTSNEANSKNATITKSPSLHLPATEK